MFKLLYLAVLQVIDAQGNIVQVIHGLTRNEPMYEKLLPVGLLYDAHLKTLVFNGKIGHLQFYDLLQDKLMFNVSKLFLKLLLPCLIPPIYFTVFKYVTTFFQS